MEHFPATRGGEALSLGHRREINAHLAALPELAFSEASFANLFLFRGVHRYRFHREPWPHISGVTYDGVAHVMPLVALSPTRAEALSGRTACLYPVAEQDVAALGAGWHAEFVAEDSDYLFDARTLAALPKERRRQARKLEQLFAPELTIGVPNFTEMAVPILDLWLAEVGKSSEATDYDNCREAIEHGETLGLINAVASIAGESCGFLLASPLPDGSMAVHFAKATRIFPALYPWMFSQFASRCGRPRLNFEQDLGLPGLRQAKRALDPLRMLHKYRVRPRPPDEAAPPVP
ncbi:phosphatidylglycerol lysyltransferase domain-containing protein [Novosphingobium pentaromativorans]|uniref:Phosphatidylglycerol lysyltransferase C-terminal domain-containing protein n=1 Tax=Novosphingobium pentaromativorans US6-1 TaxID=1088721 RepID=G6E874_9SPHN|nr:phosphatidylglycerol lysyltransferase domain-containing protein [Novosphingobium pentaromativorans]AIT81431.1 hypothetical protein JI59_17380 [Novosphingobium pentaromativorans US6-1]EHJ62414.1 hypothetical protein NSU_0545 [Novosphingobium pentaromativorans US6-1]